MPAVFKHAGLVTISGAIIARSLQGYRCDNRRPPSGVYVYWRDGFYVALNYSSENYTVKLPDTAKVLIGEKTFKPADVLVWTE